jgi:hypothetical protein
MRDKLIELITENLVVETWDNGEFIDHKVNVEEIVDCLLAKGVTINPYPLMFNQTVYVITEKQPCWACRSCTDIYHKQCPFEDKKEPVIKKAEVCSIEFNDFEGNTMLLSFDEDERHLRYGDELSLSEFGKTVFFTREEAEQALKGGAKE